MMVESTEADRYFYGNDKKQMNIPVWRLSRMEKCRETERAHETRTVPRDTKYTEYWVKYWRVAEDGGAKQHYKLQPAEPTNNILAAMVVEVVVVLLLWNVCWKVEIVRGEDWRANAAPGTHSGHKGVTLTPRHTRRWWPMDGTTIMCS